MSGVINVTMLDVMKDRFQSWLRSQGLDMIEMEASDEESEAGTTPYVVVIQPGSPLERRMNQPHPDTCWCNGTGWRSDLGVPCNLPN